MSEILGPLQFLSGRLRYRPANMQGESATLQDNSTGKTLPTRLSIDELSAIGSIVSHAKEPLFGIDCHSGLNGAIPLIQHTMGNLACFLNWSTEGLDGNNDTDFTLRSIEALGMFRRLITCTADPDCRLFAFQDLWPIVERVAHKEGVDINGVDKMKGDGDPQLMLHILEAINNSISAGNATKILVSQSEQPVLIAGRTVPAETITIADNGTGIPEDRIECVVSKGVTFREGGTGRGMALMQEYTLQRGGILSITSTTAEDAHVTDVSWHMGEDEEGELEVAAEKKKLKKKTSGASGTRVSLYFSYP